MRSNVFKGQHGRFDETVVNDLAVRVFRNGAFGLLQAVEKFRFIGLSKKLFRQLHDSSGVLDDLDGFYPGNLIKKPAATRVHEHGMTLEFHEL